MSQQEEKKQKKSLAINKVKAPPPGHPQYNYVGGLLESVKSDFRAFGELLNLVNNKVDRIEKRTDATFEEVGSMKIELTVFKEETSKNFKKVDEKFKKVDENFKKVDERFDKVDERFDKVDEKLDGVEERLEVVEGKLGIKEMVVV